MPEDSCISFSGSCSSWSFSSTLAWQLMSFKRSDGAWERLKLINCQAKVEEKDQDEQLPEKLMQESSGILNWLLEGVQMYFRQGFHEPGSITMATDAFRGSENHIGRFVSEEYEIVESETVKTLSSELY